ncbi:hypothetical protein GDO81_014221 [Engystomops pustulosus]|uniref:BAR domain-containing protein n=1 Tax=Engystomops pustulosus TaxID=76066 RepID=A0AAV7B943_ENGPU|nr:hypothetical protein GDO81_014221 [Engystomops pustulosus]
MTVDFEECIKDSPRFRAAIDEVETDVVEIEAKLDKVRNREFSHRTSRSPLSHASRRSFQPLPCTSQLTSD